MLAAISISHTFQPSRQTNVAVNCEGQQSKSATTNAQLPMKNSEDKTLDTVISEFQKHGQPADHGRMLYKYALAYNVDPMLALAVLEAESNFDPKATNKNQNGTFDRGYFQINDGTGPWLAKRLGLAQYNHNMAYDPQLNMKMGIYYLGLLARQNSDTHFVLTAYNRGEAGAKRMLRTHGTAVSRYSQRVLHIKAAKSPERRD